MAAKWETYREALNSADRVRVAGVFAKAGTLVAGLAVLADAYIRAAGTSMPAEGIQNQMVMTGGRLVSDVPWQQDYFLLASAGVTILGAAASFGLSRWEKAKWAHARTLGKAF